MGYSPLLGLFAYSQFGCSGRQWYSCTKGPLSILSRSDWPAGRRAALWWRGDGIDTPLALCWSKA